MSEKMKKAALIAAACIAITALICVLCIALGSKSKTVYTVKDTLPDGNGKKATVILLAGQSNASGCSLDEYLKQNVTEEKYAEYENGYDNVYINYLSGLNTSQEFVKCKTLQGELAGAFGPELGLAEKLHEMYPDETFFIVKCAWGGTNLHQQWLSPSSMGRTGELYEKFAAYVKTSLEYLISKNYDVKIEAMCWMQGESDAYPAEIASAYGEHLSRFVTDVRKEFDKYAADDGIAFIDAYIAANPMYWVYYQSVNMGKDEVARLSPMNDIVDTIEVGLTCSGEPEEQPDLAHYDSLSEIKLGHLFAEHIAPYLDLFEN